jgi:hypothetical protein
MVHLPGKALAPSVLECHPRQQSLARHVFTNFELWMRF